MPHILRSWCALALFSAVVAGCSALASSTVPSPAFTTLTALPVPFGPTTLRYPSGWQVARYDVPNSFYQAIAFLGPQPMPDPCIRSGSSGTCSNWPPVQLPPNGIVVGLWSDSTPGWSFDPTVGQSVSIGGHTATLEVRAPDDGCKAVGGDEEVVVMIPMTVKWNWWELDACLRGPDHTFGEGLVREMLGVPGTP